MLEEMEQSKDQYDYSDYSDYFDYNSSNSNISVNVTSPLYRPPVGILKDKLNHFKLFSTFKKTTINCKRHFK